MAIKGKIEVIDVFLEVELVVALIVVLSLEEQLDRICEDCPPNKHEYVVQGRQRDLSPVTSL